MTENPARCLQSCVVVIPAHNEASTVNTVIEGLLRRFDYPVVVVDDASDDDTGLVARAAGAIVIPLALRLGAWGATQAGLRYALSKGFQFAITMDADGQHEAESITALAQPMLEKKSDVVIGTCTARGSAQRQFAWKVMKRISGLSLEDITSGFRIYNSKAIAVLTTESGTLLEYQDVGVLILLQSSGLRIKDVEVAMHKRKEGISRIFYSWPSVIYYLLYTLLLSVTKRNY